MVKRSSVLIKHLSFQNPKIILAGIKETMLQFKRGITKKTREGKRLVTQSWSED